MHAYLTAPMREGEVSPPTAERMPSTPIATAPTTGATPSHVACYISCIPYGLTMRIFAVQFNTRNRRVGNNVYQQTCNAVFYMIRVCALRAHVLTYICECTSECAYALVSCVSLCVRTCEQLPVEHVHCGFNVHVVRVCIYINDCTVCELLHMRICCCQL